MKISSKRNFPVNQMSITTTTPLPKDHLRGSCVFPFIVAFWKAAYRSGKKVLRLSLWLTARLGESFARIAEQLSQKHSCSTPPHFSGSKIQLSETNQSAALVNLSTFAEGRVLLRPRNTESFGWRVAETSCFGEGRIECSWLPEYPAKNSKDCQIQRTRWFSRQHFLFHSAVFLKTEAAKTISFEIAT